MRIKIQKSDVLAIVLAIASFIAIKMLYADVFSGNDFWVGAGKLAAFLGIASVAGIIYFQFKNSKVGLLSILSLALPLYGFWLVQDTTNPNTRFKILKEAYIRQSQTENLYEDLRS